RASTRCSSSTSEWTSPRRHSRTRSSPSRSNCTAPDRPSAATGRSSRPVLHACVDIGSNTTRLLVADVDDAGVWRELMTQRAYTLIGKQAGENGRLRKKTIANTVEVVATQVRLAAEMGAGDITIVATAT